MVALAGLLLIGAHEIAGRRRDLLVAGFALLVLTGVILASAALRLRLYQDAYGWTELRFYVAASIAWLAAAVTVAIALLAANRMRWLAHGLAVSAVAVTLAVSAIGPQAFVIDQNIARALDPLLVPEGGHSGLDLDYTLTLGDAAIPPLVAVLDRLPPDVRARAAYELGLRRTTLDAYAGPPDGWQSWNLSRERARQLSPAGGPAHTLTPRAARPRRAHSRARATWCSCRRTSRRRRAVRAASPRGGCDRARDRGRGLRRASTGAPR